MAWEHPNVPDKELWVNQVVTDPETEVKARVRRTLGGLPDSPSMSYVFRHACVIICGSGNGSRAENRPSHPSRTMVTMWRLSNIVMQD